jgi:rhamnose utilization protein RhaD (predicted bifunctional aldolase and dehydrogenase)
MNKELKEYIELSHLLGARSEYFQGGGGNISVKQDDGNMFVKASGFRVREAGENSGWVLLAFAPIREYYNRSDFTGGLLGESEASKFILGNLVSSAGEGTRPSIEAGFHAVIPEKWIIHSHSVYANFLTCSHEGESLMKKIAETEKWDTLWVPYTHPGHHLARAIAEALKTREKAPSVYFLENHGLIVTGGSSKEVLQLHEAVNEILRERYGGEFSVSDELSFQEPLFPDQEVFCGGENENYSEKELEARREIFSAANAIYEGIQKAQLKPKFIGDEGRQYLRDMDSEKYRKEFLKK